MSDSTQPTPATIETERNKLLAESTMNLGVLLSEAAHFPGPVTPEIRLNFGLEVLSAALTIFDVCLPTPAEIADAEGEDNAQRAALFVILAGIAHDAVKASLEKCNAAFEAAESAAVDAFVEAEIKSVQIKGWNLSLVNDPYPKAKFSDYLPPGVDPTNPAHMTTYKLSIEQAKEAGRLRLIAALKASPLSWLVKETVAAQSLRAATVGDEAPKDERGRPLIPENVAEVLDIKPRPGVRMTKARK